MQQRTVFREAVHGAHVGNLSQSEISAQKNAELGNPAADLRSHHDGEQDNDGDDNRAHGAERVNGAKTGLIDECASSPDKSKGCATAPVCMTVRTDDRRKNSLLRLAFAAANATYPGCSYTSEQPHEHSHLRARCYASAQPTLSSHDVSGCGAGYACK